jgi:hypothetical protein
MNRLEVFLQDRVLGIEHQQLVQQFHCLFSAPLLGQAESLLAAAPVKILFVAGAARFPHHVEEDPNLRPVRG